MFLDFSKTGNALAPRYDVCIAGAGAAGITMAMRLAEKGARVCLLEAGGTEFDAHSQALYKGESTGRERVGPAGCRLRYFGGTTNHWEGWCARLEEIDFHVREWVAFSGWPIKRSDLDSYYKQASGICQLGELGDFSSPPLNHLPEFDPARLWERNWVYSPPTRFGDAYGDILRGSRFVDVVLHANLTRILTAEEATRIEAFCISSLDGREGVVNAGAYVLACGGLENARLLLANSDHNKRGLGNGSDCVGRFFMQHPEHKVARILTNEPVRLAKLFRRRSFGNSKTRPFLAVGKQLQSQFKLLNGAFDFDSDLVAMGEGYQTLRGIWRDAAAMNWPTNLDQKVMRVLGDLDGLAEDVWRAEDERISGVQLRMRSEQMPNPDSRVTLVDAQDQFGMRKLSVDWRLTDEDKRSMLISTQRIGEEMARLGIGRIQIAEWLRTDEWPDPIWAGCHHMGTTRMSENSANGVVDGDCKMHEIDNLYVAGSSVFPTGGYAPPTLTIVALALRLADFLHVKTKQAGR